MLETSRIGHFETAVGAVQTGDGSRSTYVTPKKLASRDHGIAGLPVPLPLLRASNPVPWRCHHPRFSWQFDRRL